MKTYTPIRKSCLSKQSSEWKKKICERNRREFKPIAMSKIHRTAVKVTSELYQHLDSPMSMITARRRFHKHNIYGIISTPNLLFAVFSSKPRLQWCHIHKTKLIDKWSKIIWSHE
ncbi:hypothetical protein TNCV_637721 [Trichonephila clavipes]|nr:hypothetical protein TNCV_637721 [Trichonephila clavipes]